MAMKMLNDEDLNKVSGGSIMFTPDCTMCGLNRDNQCIVNDFESVIKFIDENKYTMTEQDMMRAMCASGLITRI